MKSHFLENAKAVFLDWDGTSADTEKLSASVIQHVLSEEISTTFPAATPLVAGIKTVGLDFAQVCDQLTARIRQMHGVTVEIPIEELRIQKLRPAIRAAAPTVSLSTGFKAFLSKAYSHGIPLAVVSNSPACNILPVVQAHGLDVFLPRHSVFSALDMFGKDKCKPRPDIYRYTMETLNVLPARCVTFEDSVPGVRAAKEAGIGTIVGYTGLIDEGKVDAISLHLQQAGATIIARNFPSFVRTRQQMNSRRVPLPA
jgi:HAD superfamily hydrolase (TIGR01509 family)